MESAMVDYDRMEIRQERGVPSPIQQGMATLRDSIERAMNTAGKLEDRIEPILAPAPPSGDTALMAVTGDSSVAAFLRDQIRAVEELCDRLGRMSARVEL